METDRRGFFRLIGGALTFASGAAAAADALDIHAETGNTRLGALGVRLRALRDPFAPFKPYPAAKRLALPPADARSALSLSEAVRGYTSARGFRTTAFSLAELSRLLYFTNGVTGRATARGRVLHLRAAPSAGALYAGEVYVVAQRVRGLDPGVYYYAALEHEIVALRSGSFMKEVASALDAPATCADAPAAMLLTNVFRRYRHRYANRGYRFALIDSGHIGENLRLTARSAGFGSQGPLRFHDDALAALLEVDGREEAVCAVHVVGRPGKAGAAPRRRFAEKRETLPAAVPARADAPERYHEATKLVPTAARWRLPEEAWPERRSDAGVALPTGYAVPRTTVEETIRKRRSAERFGDGPLSLEELAFVLEMAGGHTALQRAPGVEVHLVAHRVRDLGPGHYRYDRDARRLVLIRAGDLRASMTSACLGQEKAGAADAGFVMVARLAESAARSGDRSYRNLLLEAGGVGQRIYLAAEASGLAARNLAAYLDDEFNALLGLDGRREAAVHLTLLG
ncbi:MAG: SagB/ThcOx family dehydrogenase [Myxococcales bacterium]|nr:SagB/ThcOx family dehydrogenase [Myxococcales bacterium]